MAVDRQSVEAIVFNKHGVGHMARVSRFPRAGETIRALEWHFDEDGGKGTNVAVALSLNGIRTALVTRVGKDSGGMLGERWLKKAGVDCSHYWMDPKVATDVGVVLINTAGENVVIGSPEHPCTMTAEELSKALEDFPQARCFLSGFEFDPSLALEGCRMAKEKGLTVMLNPSPLGAVLPESLEDVDYLFVNAVEAEQMAGTEGRCEEKIRRLQRQYGARHVVMTLGAEGCLTCSDGKVEMHPGYEVECVSSVAAGDAFMAAFASVILAGGNLREAADWGNRYGAVTVSRPGAILSYPSRTEAERIAAGLHRRKNNGGI